MTGRRHTAVIDLAFGDAGKGATVDWLCASAAEPISAVVRFNGGAQAAHNVVVGGLHHTFRQFGSGTFSGTRTYLSERMLVHPHLLATEAEELAGKGIDNPLHLVDIAAGALITTPVHGRANRAREAERGTGRHGSCGLGIGETAWYALGHDAPTVGDCADPAVMEAKLVALLEFYRPLVDPRREHDVAAEARELAELYLEFHRAVNVVGAGHLAVLAARGPLVFEGAQGVLLDEWAGTHPHTTWSTVVPTHVRRMVAEIGDTVEILGVTRAYTTRHGAGPFPTQDDRLTRFAPEPHNGNDGAQGVFRVGHLDPILLRYAIEACGGVDALAVTHLDTVGTGGFGYATGYRGPDGHVDALPVQPIGGQDLDVQRALTDLLYGCTPDLEPVPTGQARLVDLFEDQLGIPVALVADGPDRSNRTTPTTPNAAAAGRRPARPGYAASACP